jgi:hypothetical protein
LWPIGGLAGLSVPAALDEKARGLSAFTQGFFSLCDLQELFRGKLGKITEYNTCVDRRVKLLFRLVIHHILWLFYALFISHFTIHVNMIRGVGQFCQIRLWKKLQSMSETSATLKKYAPRLDRTCHEAYDVKIACVVYFFAGGMITASIT